MNNLKSISRSRAKGLAFLLIGAEPKKRPTDGNRMNPWAVMRLQGRTSPWKPAGLRFSYL
jgi:hypothetical protein